mgnify:CR=1 FL=1
MHFFLQVHQRDKTQTMRPLLIALLSIFSCSLFAQFNYTGCVTDEEDNPLIGVSVIEKGTINGTVTDVDGCFTLSLSRKEAKLELSYTGYDTKTIKAVASKSVSIKLSDAKAVLDEVVVVGYATAKKRDMPKSSARISMEDAAHAPAADAYGYDPISFAATSKERAVSPGPAAGQLTAGETNDFGKWEMWEDISQEDLAMFRDIWGFYPDHRYAVQLTYPGGRPATNIKVSLQNGNDHVWTARTDNRGRAEMWSGMNDAQATANSQLSLVAHHDGKTYALSTGNEFKDGINQLELPLACNSPAAVDIAFVVDATGSMGDEMSYLNSELTDVIKRAKEKLTNADLRTAAVFYRDSTDDYVTRHQDFSPSAENTVAYCAKQTHGGGGDHPEAVDAALETAITQLHWQDEAVARLLFLVLAAPPHQDEATLARLRTMTAAAAAKGIRVIPVVCSGMTKDGEYLLRSIALATNGTYVFLTDDSGIGGSHLAPTTDAYEVEKLNDLMVRLITSFSESTDCNTKLEDQVVSKKLLADDELRFKVFPTPTSGPVTMKFSKAKGDVYLFDLTGKLLRRITISGRKERINMSGLASGTYLLRWIDGDRQGVERVVLT